MPDATAAQPTPADQRLLVVAKALALGLIAALLTTQHRNENYPLVHWHLYSGQDDTEFSSVAARPELRIIDITGATHSLLYRDLFTIDDDSSQEPAGEEVIDLVLDDNDRTPFYRGWLAWRAETLLGAPIREIEVWRFEWPLQYDRFPLIDLANPASAELLLRFTGLAYQDLFMPPPAPESNMAYTFGDLFELTAFELPLGNQVEQCHSLYARTWWRTVAEPDTNYQASLTLTDVNGVGRAQSDAALGTVMSLQLPAGVDFFDGRELAIPCDLEPGDYDLLLVLYPQDAAAAQVPISAPEGLGVYAYLTSVTVVGGDA